jgi:hypothetical protein
MKVAMLNLLGNVPLRLNSHNAGWTFCLASIIESRCNVYPDFINDAKDIKNYDYIVINNGINYKKDQWNFFGGVQDATIDKLKELCNFKGDLISYNEEVNFNSLLKRKEIHEVPVKKVHLKYTETGDNLILGDSHSLSIFKKGYSIKRLDGKTLHGFLKDPYKYFNKRKVKNLYLYFGNIDVRFHLLRQKNPKKAVEILCEKYFEFSDKLYTKYNCNVNIQGLLPIESENRKIPGTGLYKEKPYFGSQEERENIRKYFNSYMNARLFTYNYKIKFVKPWLDYPLSFEHMEARQSVHIRPNSYLNKDSFIC